MQLESQIFFLNKIEVPNEIYDGRKTLVKSNFNIRKIVL